MFHTHLEHSGRHTAVRRDELVHNLRALDRVAGDRIGLGHAATQSPQRWRCEGHRSSTETSRHCTHQLRRRQRNATTALSPAFTRGCGTLQSHTTSQCHADTIRGEAVVGVGRAAHAAPEECAGRYHHRVVAGGPPLRHDATPRTTPYHTIVKYAMHRPATPIEGAGTLRSTHLRRRCAHHHWGVSAKRHAHHSHQ